MDLGFAGLIEKIEERCGKLVATALLWVLVFVVFALGIQTLVGSFVAVHEMMVRGGGSLWSVAGNIVIVIIAIVGLTALLSVAAGKYFENRSKKRLNELRDYEEGVKRRVETIIANTERDLREAEQEAKQRILVEAINQGLIPPKDQGETDA